MTQPFQESPDPMALFAEIQQDVKGDSSNANNGQDQQSHEQAVPYDRFAQVNNQKNEYEKKYTDLLEQLTRQQSAQQGASYQQAQQAGQQAAQAATNLLTPEEIAYFEQQTLVNPGEALQQFGMIIQERGVNREVSRLRDEMDQKMNGYVNQFSQQMAPMAISSFKQAKMSDQTGQQISPIFDQLLAQEMQTNPGVINNPAALELIREVSISRAFQQGLLTGTQSNQRQVPFTEQPGSQYNLRPQQSQADARTIQVGKLLGLNEDTINKVHNVFETNGVYRND